MVIKMDKSEDFIKSGKKFDIVFMFTYWVILSSLTSPVIKKAKQINITTSVSAIMFFNTTEIRIFCFFFLVSKSLDTTYIDLRLASPFWIKFI